MGTREDLAEQVQKALVAHGAWKVRLAQAIASGASEFDPERVVLDSQCPLGMWLHSDLDPALKIGDHFEKVLKLHAEFHAAAGRVLRLALLGLKSDAAEAMEPDSGFARASTHLTLALTAWRAAFEG